MFKDIIIDQIQTFEENMIYVCLLKGARYVLL